jgi:ribosomal protein S18 acetylase RimI-like enzyme
VKARAGSHADEAAAIAVYHAANDARAGASATTPEMLERVRFYLSLPDAFLIVAEDETEIVGMAVGMHAREDDSAGPPILGVGYIAMVYVRPDRWGEGIGGAMLDALLIAVPKRGYRRWLLWTHVDNLAAQRLYERRGFTPAGREKINEAGERIRLYERAR